MITVIVRFIEEHPHDWWDENLEMSNDSSLEDIFRRVRGIAPGVDVGSIFIGFSVPKPLDAEEGGKAG